jgi:predicted permease
VRETKPYEQHTKWWVDTIMQDVCYALRGFRRNLIFTVTVITTLALGIGSTTAIFSVVDPILFRSLPYGHADRLVSVGITQSLEPHEFTFSGFYFDWQEAQKPFEALTSQGIIALPCDLTERNPTHLKCANVQANFLPTLGIRPLIGRNFLPEEDRPNGPRVALISYGFWLSRFNLDPAVVNKLIDLDGNSVQIIGVLPKTFELPTLETADLLLPLSLEGSGQRTVNGGIGMPLRSFARLKSGVSVEQAQAELGPLFKDAQRFLPPDVRNNFHLKIRSLRDRQMEDVSLVAWMLLGAVLAVLLIACANVTSLMMTRGLSRERELAVCSALGASKGRLVRRALTESLLLSAAGTASGCVLAKMLISMFTAMAPAGISFLYKARLDFRIIVFAILTSLIVTTMCALFPALQKPRARALVSRSAAPRTHAYIRRSLVVAQIAISMILLSCANLLLRSFWKLQEQSLGMQTYNVLTINIPLASQHYDTAKKCMDFFLSIEPALRGLPGVTAVGISDSLPPDGWHQSNRYSELSVVGKLRPTEGIGGTVVVRTVTPDYFRALDIPIVQGRRFTEEERNSTDHLIILSKLLASRMFPNEKPIGRQISGVDISSPSSTYMVVGVAGNVKNSGLAEQDVSEYYLLKRNFPDVWSRLHTMLVVRTVLSPTLVASSVRSRISQINPTAPIDIETFHQKLSALEDPPRFTTALLGFFAFVGLLMAAIGLYGVISFIASLRTPEIGVRLALGASRLDILKLIIWEGVRIISLGIIFGLSVTLAISRLLTSLLFSISPYDPTSFICVALLLALVALIATFIPARAAMNVEPLEALRYE